MSVVWMVSYGVMRMGMLRKVWGGLRVAETMARHVPAARRLVSLGTEG